MSRMKIGQVYYRSMLTPENFKFARQAGCTHVVAHLVDYQRNSAAHGTVGQTIWPVRDPKELWSEDFLRAIKRSMNNEGLEWEALENIDPNHWHDVLLDGPQKKQHLENVKTLIRTMGKVGIPILGYNFSLAGVWGLHQGPCARGGAISWIYDRPDAGAGEPIPNGMVWNMAYDPDAPAGTLPSVTNEELWGRLAEFLHEVVPVAEEAGVKLAAHPDDPPLPVLRGTPRLIHQARFYQRLLDLYPSPCNTLEFCLGSLQEMTETNICEVVDRYSSQGKVAYVHFRNVRGKVPHYEEVFVDEGDIDMFRVLRILKKNGFEGVLMPDHTPYLECSAPWHAGMAYALGYMRAALRAIEEED